MLKTVKELIADLQENYDENEVVTGTLYSESDILHAYPEYAEGHEAWSYLSMKLAMFIETLQEDINIHLSELMEELDV